MDHRTSQFPSGSIPIDIGLRRVSTMNVINALDPWLLTILADSEVDHHQWIDHSLETALQNSMRETPPVRKVLSKSGESCLKEVTWAADERNLPTSCPISTDDFSEGQKVTILPCKHCFQPESIATWLKTHDASCPVCRYQLPHKEVSDLPTTPTPDRQTPGASQGGWVGTATYSFELSY